jgi:hypothetical protein
MSNKRITFVLLVLLYPGISWGQSKVTGPFCPEAVFSKLIILVFDQEKMPQIQALLHGYRVCKNK